MVTAAIIQARMASTRLPGKVLMSLGRRTMLGHVIDRTLRIPGLDRVVVATTTRAEDDAVEDAARIDGVSVYRGAEGDVVDRYYRAARMADADIIYRLTADCPLLDPRLCATVLTKLKGADYASNVWPRRTYPDGLDCEVFTRDALEAAWQGTRAGSRGNAEKREHPTLWMRKHLRCASVEHSSDLSAVRWTVDVTEDLDRVRWILHHLGPRSDDWHAALLVPERPGITWPARRWRVSVGVST